MDFAQNFAATEGFIGLLAQSNASSAKVPVPPTQTKPTKSVARRARQKAKEEANIQARINAAMVPVQLAPHPPFTPPPYPGFGFPPACPPLLCDTSSPTDTANTAATATATNLPTTTTKLEHVENCYVHGYS